MTLQSNVGYRCLKFTMTLYESYESYLIFRYSVSPVDIQTVSMTLHDFSYYWEPCTMQLTVVSSQSLTSVTFWPHVDCCTRMGSPLCVQPRAGWLYLNYDKKCHPVEWIYNLEHYIRRHSARSVVTYFSAVAAW